MIVINLNSITIDTSIRGSHKAERVHGLIGFLKGVIHDDFYGELKLEEGDFELKTMPEGDYTAFVMKINRLTYLPSKKFEKELSLKSEDERDEYIRTEVPDIVRLIIKANLLDQLNSRKEMLSRAS